MIPKPAEIPTMYFIGVSTKNSSIMKLFPLWADALGLDNAALTGIDVEINAPKEVYREVVEFIKQDPLSLGALVTTHKINLFNAARDIFDYFDPYAQMFGELSCISKRNGRLEGHAKDPISSGLALEAFIPRAYWSRHRGEAFIMGAGGSSIALSSYLLKPEMGENIPTKITVSDIDNDRLQEMASIVEKVNPDVRTEFNLVKSGEENDKLLQSLPPYSLVVNATGLGKDRPGSPLSDSCVFPENSLVWEFNYRGELLFLQQARAQQQQRGLYVEDGWTYFIHGWTQVIGEVFNVKIDGAILDRLERIANEQLERNREESTDEATRKAL